ncbi:MAG: RNA polymerase sigma factor SigF [Mycobacterium sp.]
MGRFPDRFLKGRLVPSSSNEYADVADMFRTLATLDPESSAFARQREAIVARCLPIADHIARRFRGRGELHEDLLQVARIGLMNAVNRYDVEANPAFLGFAVPTMMGEVRRHFRDRGWSVKVPRRLKELHVQLNRARPELTHRLGREPTPTELAEHLGIDRETVVEAVVAGQGYSASSTDRAMGDEVDSMSVGERMGDEDAGFEKVLQVETLRPLVAALADRERTVLHLRFFENMSQSQIAERVGVSQMHVSRLLAKALAALRHQANALDDVHRQLPAATRRLQTA